MKPAYWAVIGILGIVWFISAIAYFPIETTVQAFMAGATAAAAVTALGLADPPKREISIKQLGSAYLQKDADEKPRNLGHPVPYIKDEIPQPFRVLFENYPDSFHSYRVGFQLINTSGFALRKPRMTITVPANRMHPKDPGRKLWDPTCSALFGPTIEQPSGNLTEDAFAITAKLADDWSREARKTFWVRMVLDRLPDDPFAFDVAVTSDEAEGGYCRITITPNELIKSAMPR